MTAFEYIPYPRGGGRRVETWTWSTEPPGMKLSIDAIIARMVALEEDATRAAVITELRRQGYIVISPFGDDEARAEAWDEGFRAGDEAATGHLTDNPYRDTGIDHEEGANLAPRPKSAGRWRSRQEEA